MMWLAVFAAAAGCVAPGGDRIVAADIAKHVPEFRAIAPELVLSHAPVPGVQRVFQPAELNQILRRHDVAGEVASPVCFEWPLRTLDGAEAAKAMQASLPHKSSVRVVELSRRPVPHGPVEFLLAGLDAPEPNGSTAMWKGAVRYTAGKKIDVWAKVIVSAPFTRVVTTRAVRATERLDESCVRFESGSGHPQPAGAIERLEDAVGAVARRLLPPGTAIRTADLNTPAAITKGDPVRVEVLAGPARLSFTAVAMGSGNIGQFVAVSNPLNRKTIRVRVTGAGRAVIGANP